MFLIYVNGGKSCAWEYIDDDDDDNDGDDNDDDDDGDDDDDDDDWDDDDDGGGGVMMMMTKAMLMKLMLMIGMMMMMIMMRRNSTFAFDALLNKLITMKQSYQICAGIQKCENFEIYRSQDYLQINTFPWTPVWLWFDKVE